jgi:Flp pilus assembly protein TadB
MCLNKKTARIRILKLISSQCHSLTSKHWVHSTKQLRDPSIWCLLLSHGSASVLFIRVWFVHNPSVVHVLICMTWLWVWWIRRWKWTKENEDSNLTFPIQSKTVIIPLKASKRAGKFRDRLHAPSSLHLCWHPIVFFMCCYHPAWHCRRPCW